MEIEQSTYAPETITRHCMGAGIIPLARDPDGVPHLLLGRERWIPQWKGSCRWSGFEGSRKAQEESVAVAATREFVEESLGVVRLESPRRAGGDETIGRPAGSPALRVLQRLRSGDFWRRIVLRIHTERRTSERLHCTYVVPVAWDPDVSARFQTLRASIEHVDRLLQEWRHTRPLCLGEHGEHVGRLTVLREDPDGPTCVATEKLASTSPCILRHPWTRHASDDTLVGATFDDARDVHLLCEWFALRDRLERALIDHPSLTVKRDDRWGCVQDVQLQRDHLEKDQIRWWSVTDLEAVLAGRGQLGAERFRPYHLPVLQTVLAEIRAHDGRPPLDRSAPAAPDAHPESTAPSPE